MEKKYKKMENEADKMVEKHKKILMKIGQTLETLHKNLTSLSEETDNNSLLVTMILMVIHTTIGNMPIDQQKTLLNDYLRLENAAAQCETPEEMIENYLGAVRDEEEIRHLYV